MQIVVQKKGKSGEQLEVLCGYDKRLDYVFMCVYDKEQNLIYDNLALPNALEIKDFDFFSLKAKDLFGIDLKDEHEEINQYQQIEKAKQFF